MAKFSFNGMDEISASFEQIANLTDEDKMTVIRPAAERLLQRQKEKIRSLFRRRTGALEDSLTIEERNDGEGTYAHIYPKGKHPGSSTGKRKGKRRSIGKYSGTNAEVGYIHEFGSARIAASHWMEDANEEAADEVVTLQQQAWDELLTKKGL